MADRDLDLQSQELDRIDEALLRLLSERLRLCSEIAGKKRAEDLPAAQPTRAEDRRDRVAQKAVAFGLEPNFVRALWDRIGAETNRLEGETGSDGGASSRLQANAYRIDHIAIAVEDLEASIALYRDVVGFKLIERRATQGDHTGMVSAVMQAGNVMFVLVQGTEEGSQVSRFIQHFGPGVQHVAIEVANLESVVGEVADRGLPLLTKIIHSDGLDQVFSRRNPTLGLQLELVERHGRTGFADQNVAELFKAMERDDAF
jgi:methylmalonyl-CoA epimerase